MTASAPSSRSGGAEARRARRAARSGRFGVLAAAMAAIAALPLGGCEGTSIGNPPGATGAQIQLGLQGRVVGASARGGALPDAGVVGGEESSPVVLDEVWLAFGDASLLAAGHCGADGGQPPGDDVGAFAAELVSGRVLPARPVWSRPADEGYCQLRTRLDGASAAVAGAPAGLEGVTLFARGKRLDGVPLEAHVALPAEVARGSEAAAFSLGSGAVGMVLVFDFDDWFLPEPLAAAAVEGGRILIDSTHNAPIAASISAAVPPSARLFRDDDRDGRHDEAAEREELGY